MSEVAFLNLLGRLSRAVARYEGVRTRLSAALGGTTYVTLPVPRVGREAKVTVEVDLDVTPELHLAFSTPPPGRVGRVTFTASRGLAVTLEGLKLSVGIGPTSHISNLLFVALIYRKLLQRGVDILSLLEEQLGAPGLFSDLRAVFELVAQLVEESGVEREKGVVEA